MALRRHRSVAEAAEKEIGKLREEIAGLSAEIRARSEEAVEETWQECVDALAAARARVAGYEKDVAVLQRLRTALEAARSQARETYLKPVMTELRPLLGLLFDDVSITFDDKTLLPHKILRNGQEEDVERLSGGMREQLSVLTRLAFARLLAKDGRPHRSFWMTRSFIPTTTGSRRCSTRCTVRPGNSRSSFFPAASAPSRNMADFGRRLEHPDRQQGRSAAATRRTGTKRRVLTINLSPRRSSCAIRLGYPLPAPGLVFACLAGHSSPP